jgi:hypothetical protein
LVSVLKLSVILQFVTGVLPLLFLVIYKKKLRVEFVILLLASAITTLILLITASFGLKNWFFFNFYNAIYLTCITIFYFSLLRSSPLRKYVLILSFLCGAVLIYDLTYLDLITWVRFKKAQFDSMVLHQIWWPVSFEKNCMQLDLIW